jgi:hypothetical protein
MVVSVAVAAVRLLLVELPTRLLAVEAAVGHAVIWTAVEMVAVAVVAALVLVLLVAVAQAVMLVTAGAVLTAVLMQVRAAQGPPDKTAVQIATMPLVAAVLAY